MTQQNGKRLEGKVAIITGATGGIGEATAKRFPEDGASVTLVFLQCAESTYCTGGIHIIDGGFTAI